LASAAGLTAAQADLSGVQDLDVVLIRSRVVVGNGLSLDYYVSW
jgi:hypothetical protein